MTDIDFKTVPVAGEPSSAAGFLMWFGAYGEEQVAVLARSADDALEVAFEWLDEHAPGHLTRFREEDYREATTELGLEWKPSWPDYSDPDYERVVEHAEVDHTMCGHTTLKHGTHLRSWEWSVRELDRGEHRTVQRRFCGACDVPFVSGERWPLCAACLTDWTTSLAEDLQAERDELDADARAAGCDGEPEPSLDVRVQVRTWAAGYHLHVGDGARRPDHCGDCGVSSVGRADSDATLFACAAELISQAIEHASSNVHTEETPPP